MLCPASYRGVGRLMCCAFALLVPLHSGWSQENKSHLEVVGFVGVASTMNSRFLTLGGPSIKGKYGDWQGGLSFFPSVRFESQGSAHSINPQLGVGLVIDYRNFAVLLPFYSLKETTDKDASLKAALGVGYRL